MNYARPPTSRPATRPEATHDSGTLHQNAFRTAARWDGRAARFGLKDVAHSLRLFRRSPGFTIAAVAALTLGIGTNTAIFTVVNAVLLKPVPFPTPIVRSLLFDAHRSIVRRIAPYRRRVCAQAEGDFPVLPMHQPSAAENAGPGFASAAAAAFASTVGRIG